MTILWIPHSPFHPGSIRRDQHLIRHLKDRHRIISVTWEAGNKSVVEAFRKGFQFYKTTLEDGRAAYHVRRVPDLTRRLRRNKREAMRLNEIMFQRDIKMILNEEGVDILVVAYSEFMTGKPPFEVNVPIVFDYLDCADWTKRFPREREYIQKADAVTAVSNLAELQAKSLNERTVFIPNGADINTLRSASGKKVRETYDLSGDRVVSLIGLMDSNYLIEAVLQARKEVENLKCLLVGKSKALQEEINMLSGRKSEAFIYVGPVPHSEVADFFAATDVGLYPVPGLPYDDGRSPIKIFEYLAAGKSVVSPPIKEVRRLGFENIVYADPGVETFASGIVKAFNMKEADTEPSIGSFDWKVLAKRFEKVLKDLTS